jgi:iron(III) transport system substrate-binding protein
MASSGCGGDEGDSAGAAAATGDPALDKLIAAARKEGELTFYSVPDERITARVAKAFKDKYGIDANYTRLPQADLVQRFSSESEAGAPSADVILPLYDSFLADAIGKDWALSLSEAKVPGYPPKHLPADAVVSDPGTAIVQVTLAGFGFNTGTVSKDKAPTTWPDLLDPSFKGKILLPDPTKGQVYTDLFYAVQKKYGLEYLSKLRAQASRIYQSGAPMTEGLAAGEGGLAIPSLPGVLAVVKEQGAPVDWTIPSDVLLGSPTVVGIAAKAKYPNAARLFVHYLLSREGLEALNDGPGLASPMETENRPTDYATPDLDKEANKTRDAMYRALGFKR